MIKVFCDYHHSALLQSFILLFEQRFGGEVYRPIGRDWYDKGYWKIYDHPATVAQYLDPGSATPDGSSPLNQTTGDSSSGIYFCDDIQSGGKNKAITYNAFMATNFDIVIASVPQHIAPFRKLCDEHPNHPKLIYQIGNAWTITNEQNAMVDGIMASAKCPLTPTKPYIEYHQEFDLGVFNLRTFAQLPEPVITSFVNCFNTDQLFALDWQVFRQTEISMPNYEFKAMGGGCRDGSAHGAHGVAAQMERSRFIWHTKAGGDGYGHVIHTAAARGIPLIVRKSYYDGKMAEPLLKDGETCIVIDGLSGAQIVDKINQYSEPEIYRQMCDKTYDNFLANVDFDREAQEIEKFLSIVNGR